MLLISAFRICLLLIFLIAVMRLGDWKNWQKYYSTVLFVIIANLLVSFLTYHHVLWYYNPDILVKTSSTVELLNSFFMLPVSTFIYLSKYPTGNKLYQYGYVVLWVCIYVGLEFIDHYVVKGISYGNGWSASASAIFDIAIFSIIRLHYLRPLWAWGASLLVLTFILILFDFISGEFK